MFNGYYDGVIFYGPGIKVTRVVNRMFSSPVVCVRWLFSMSEVLFPINIYVRCIAYRQ